MEAREDATQMAAHLVAANPYAARPLSVAVEDQRLDVVRIHKRILIDAVLRLRSLRFVNAKNARVVSDAGIRSVEGLDRGRLVGRACREATRAYQRAEQRQRSFKIHGTSSKIAADREADCVLLCMTSGDACIIGQNCKKTLNLIASRQSGDCRLRQAPRPGPLSRQCAEEVVYGATACARHCELGRAQGNEG